MNENFTNAKNELAYVVSQILFDLDRYKKSPNCNNTYFHERRKKAHAIVNYYNESNKFVDELMEVIKKQALIIEAAGIEYPTINQSLGHIHDIYLQAKGRGDEIGMNNNITVEIKVI